MAKFWKGILYIILAALALSACVSCAPFGSMPASAVVVKPTPFVVFPTVPPATEEPTPVPTAEPTPVPTAEPTPTPAPTPLPDGHEWLTDAERMMLVNFDNRLPKRYVPHDLVYARDVMGDSCVLNHKYIRIQYEVALHLKEMFEAAYADGIDTTYIINSAYRAMGDQWSMWNRKLANRPHYGDNPYENPVAVMPGDASEHVAGLAVDIASVNHPRENEDFGATPEGIWLRENAHRFGFIFRYPGEKSAITGVKYEPWHFRYVGVGLAELIFESGLCLEEFLG